jgi:Protein of unknown function (DUF2794)
VSDGEPIDLQSRLSAPAGQSSSVAETGANIVSHLTRFDRFELDAILKLYGRMVARGEWRDYAIDMNCHQAVFAVFRRASDVALYTIIKDMRLARKQGAYSVVAATGLILKRGHDLDRVLAVLDKPKLVTL